MILTGKCKFDFLIEHWLIPFFLPEKYQNLLILRWFNRKTEINVSIDYWPDDGFDYGVCYKHVDAVYLSNKRAGERTNDYDEIVKYAIIKANQLYSRHNL